MRNSFVRALCLAVATASVAAAQDEGGDRRGFTGSIGMGISSAGISCAPQCAADRESGPAYMLRIGGHISPQFTLGLEANIFRAVSKQVDPPGNWSLAWLTMTGLWYPSSDDDFFLKLGLGIGTSRVVVPFSSVPSLELNASDFGAVAGIGKDFRFTDNLALTAFADILFTPRSSAQTNGSNAGVKISADLIHIGLAITIP